MRRLLPSPALAIALLVLWVLLMQSLSVGVLLLGAALAWSWSLVAARLATTLPRPRRLVPALRLLGRVVVDMAHGNAVIAWAILTRRSRSLRSRFVLVPLELRDPHALAALAAIVTFTPGTAWTQLAADGRSLLVHVLDEDDAEPTAAIIQRRYETLLREIFE